MSIAQDTQVITALTTRHSPPVNVSLKIHPWPQSSPHHVESLTSARRLSGAIVAEAETSSLVAVSAGAPGDILHASPSNPHTGSVERGQRHCNGACGERMPASVSRERCLERIAGSSRTKQSEGRRGRLSCGPDVVSFLDRSTGANRSRSRGKPGRPNGSPGHRSRASSRRRPMGSRQTVRGDRMP